MHLPIRSMQPVVEVLLLAFAVSGCGDRPVSSHDDPYYLKCVAQCERCPDQKVFSPTCENWCGAFTAMMVLSDCEREGWQQLWDCVSQVAQCDSVFLVCSDPQILYWDRCAQKYCESDEQHLNECEELMKQYGYPLWWR
jgi:hypothetical protein